MCLGFYFREKFLTSIKSCCCFCAECTRYHYGPHCEACPCNFNGSLNCDDNTGLCECSLTNGECTCADGWTGHNCEGNLDERT